MEEEYVRKDVFEEIMKRMDVQNAKSEAQHREYMARQDVQIAEIRGEVKELRGEIKALAQQVDGLGDTIVAYVSGFSSKGSFWQGVLGAIIGLSAIVVAGVQVYLAVKAG